MDAEIVAVGALTLTVVTRANGPDRDHIEVWGADAPAAVVWGERQGDGLWLWATDTGLRLAHHTLGTPLVQGVPADPLLRGAVEAVVLLATARRSGQGHHEAKAA